MAPLILDSLQIENYRLLKSLTIPRLGRVNLITGKNNVGKTAVLEAIRLWARRGTPQAIWEVLNGRREWSSGFPENGSMSVAALEDALRNLFNGRPIIDSQPWLSIGPRDRQEAVLSLGGIWLPPKGSVSNERSLAVPYIAISIGALQVEIQLDEFEKYLRFGAELLEWQPSSPRPCRYLPPGGMDERELAFAWDEIALTEVEERVIDALRLIAPEIERIHSSTSSNGRSHFRVRTSNSREPFLLSSMGDGIHRLLAISIVLAQSQGGILLLDEVENGLHYTVQVGLWRHLFRLAQELNVQVFATTHSYDCVLAFQEAAREAPEEGVLVRLERNKDQFRVTSYDEDRLQIVAREEIEVR